MGYKDSKHTAGSSVLQQECHEEVCKKIPPSISTGTCEYYKNRHDNYIQRHQYDSKSNGDNPPDYYLNYGYKYCSRFKKETYAKLSQDGKDWLMDTLNVLQVLMEQGLVDLSFVAKANQAYNDRHKLPENKTSFYTGIECRNGDFRDFAFATHPDAYNPKKMENLPCSDLITIASTPDLKEWLSWDTWEQAITMGENMSISDIALKCIDEANSYIADMATEVFEDIAKKMTRYY
ncbi:MAG: hypothetical protein L3J42_03645 [Hydrogenimonas sp.]|nr:hypothetical protein [Hydrogenimonas sp.]